MTLDIFDTLVAFLTIVRWYSGSNSIQDGFQKLSSTLFPKSLALYFEIIEVCSVNGRSRLQNNNNRPVQHLFTLNMA